MSNLELFKSWEYKNYQILLYINYTTQEKIYEIRDPKTGRYITRRGGIHTENNPHSYIDGFIMGTHFDV